MSSNSKNKQAEDFEALSGAAQILARPGMWAGSMQPIKQKMFIINKDSGVEYREIEYIPAFRKIIDEILDNSVDSLVKNCQAKGKVKVVMDDDVIYIEDNGPGIPVIRKELKDIKDSRMTDEEKKRISETYLPEIAWTRLFSGSNFKDSDDKTTVGSHGLGSKLTAIFSKKFTGVSDDGKKLCKVVAKNNLESVTTEVSETKGETGVRVKFVPDFARFGLTKVDQIYKELVYQRLICLGITFPGIKFSFNGKSVNVNDKTFLNLFSKNITFQVFDRGFIGIYPNENDDFNFFTYVDGLALNRGGSHIDYIVDKVVTPIREKLVKKYKSIKPADIKNKLSMVVFLRDFPNLKFDSQTKETLTNLPSEITKYFGDSVDFEKLSRNVIKNEFILDPIVETFKLKEEVKERVALKQAGKSKVKVDATKYIPPTGNSKKYFVIAEGFCLDDEQKVFVLNKNEHVPIKEVEIGDLVLTHNQNIKPVIDVTHKVADCVRIKTKSGKEIICSKQHRFFVYDVKKNTWRFKKICDIDPANDRLVNNKLSSGFVMRDFSISKSSNDVSKKYKLTIDFGDNVIYTSETHRFTVFNVENSTFELISAKDLNPDKMKIVVIFSPS